MIYSPYMFTADVEPIWYSNDNAEMDRLNSMFDRLADERHSIVNARYEFLQLKPRPTLMEVLNNPLGEFSNTFNEFQGFFE
jgi:hypothetical protein